MRDSNLVYRSAVASLALQIVVGVVTGATLIVNVRDTDTRRDINVVVALEVVSQVIEFLWYMWVVCRYQKIETWTRYLDWVVSTPVMLASTSLFFAHRTVGQHVLSPLTRPALYACFACNWGMLLFGYVVERECIARGPGVFVGSIFLIASFTLLATEIPVNDGLSQGLFWVMYAVWALYGVAAMLPYTPKNVAYNGLDIVSKNFYGIFLFVYALTAAAS